MATHAVITTHLDYSNMLYMGQPLRMAEKVQPVQMAAAMLLTGQLLSEPNIIYPTLPVWAAGWLLDQW